MRFNQYFIQIIIIGMGGFVGAVLRFIISTHVQQMNKGLFFPLGTLTVNLLGCLIMGFLIQLNESWHLFSPEIKSFIFIGMLGSLTTYSTFSNDALNLFIEHRYTASMIYMVTQLIFGLLAVFVGRFISQVIVFRMF
jgi:CrcB protein